MRLTRRRWISASALAMGAVGKSSGLTAASSWKEQFPVVHAETCLNNARWHPLSLGAKKAIVEYLDYKASGGGSEPQYSGQQQDKVKQLYAKLIGARSSEISFVPSTLAGENLIVAALGLPAAGGNIVTDALHFEGSLYLYGELKRQGLDVRMVRPKDGRIALRDLEKQIDKNTKLVAVSLVSMINGFQHDLKAVCERAHAQGAYVFADIVQAAGAVPIDVRESGVDFCAGASYKWLMGDMGLGFLYVREELLERLRRPQYGYRQLSEMEYHVFPYDKPADAVFDWKQKRDAAGLFEMGTVSNTTVAALSFSLEWLQQVGVSAIQEHRQPLLRRLQNELPRLGFEPMTPLESTSPIVAFAVKDTERLAGKLSKANIDIAVYPHRVRISPSLYNDEADVEKLLQCLSA
jgi:selenocysteine lyase/cysteine desulfurase